MKKLLLTFAVIMTAVAFTSCKKCYECTTASTVDPSIAATTEICDITASEAKELEDAGTAEGVKTTCVKK